MRCFSFVIKPLHLKRINISWYRKYSPTVSKLNLKHLLCSIHSYSLCSTHSYSPLLLHPLCSTHSYSLWCCTLSVLPIVIPSAPVPSLFYRELFPLILHPFCSTHCYSLCCCLPYFPLEGCSAQRVLAIISSTSPEGNCWAVELPSLPPLPPAPRPPPPIHRNRRRLLSSLYQAPPQITSPDTTTTSPKCPSHTPFLAPPTPSSEDDGWRCRCPFRKNAFSGREWLSGEQVSLPCWQHLLRCLGGKTLGLAGSVRTRDASLGTQSHRGRPRKWFELVSAHQQLCPLSSFSHSQSFWLLLRVVCSFGGGGRV